LRQGFPNKFFSPTFSLLISLMALSLKIRVFPFFEEDLLIME